jgi:uncharacterized membrane protein YgcG
MRVSLWLAIAATVLLALPQSSRAGWREFWEQFELSRRRVNAWPESSSLPDRELARTPFRMMADNGWKLQTTLDDHLFHRETQELNYAGALKLQWITNELPPHRRQVYVLEGKTPEATSLRVASVYKYLAETCPGQQPCQVVTTRIRPPSGEGSYLYSIEHAYEQTVPPPRLRSQGGGSGGASGGLGGSGGGGSGTGGP